VEAALAGAVLAELVLQRRIALSDQRVVIIDETPTQHPVLDKTLFDILNAARPRKLRYWINTLTYQRLLDEIVHHLIERNVLMRKKKRLRLVSSHLESPAGDISAQYSLKNRLRETVLAGQAPQQAERVLLAFLMRTGLLKLIFTPGERKTAHKRIKKLIEYGEEESALGDTLNEILNASVSSP